MAITLTNVAYATSGTAANNSSTLAISGISEAHMYNLVPGDIITVAGQTRTIATTNWATSVTVTVPFTPAISAQPVSVQRIQVSASTDTFAALVTLVQGTPSIGSVAGNVITLTESMYFTTGAMLLRNTSSINTLYFNGNTKLVKVYNQTNTNAGKGTINWGDTGYLLHSGIGGYTSGISPGMPIFGQMNVWGSYLTISTSFSSQIGPFSGAVDLLDRYGGNDVVCFSSPTGILTTNGDNSVAAQFFILQNSTYPVGGYKFIYDKTSASLPSFIFDAPDSSVYSNIAFQNTLVSTSSINTIFERYGTGTPIYRDCSTSNSGTFIVSVYASPFTTFQDLVFPAAWTGSIQFTANISTNPPATFGFLLQNSLQVPNFDKSGASIRVSDSVGEQYNLILASDGAFGKRYITYKQLPSFTAPTVTTNYTPATRTNCKVLIRRKDWYDTTFSYTTFSTPTTVERSLPVTDPFYTTDQSGLAGISANSGANTLTISASMTLDNAYDWMKWWLSQSTQMVSYATSPLSPTGKTFVSTHGLIIGTSTVLSTGTKFTSITVPSVTTSSALNNIVVTSNVAQATPTNLTSLNLTGNLTFNTNTNTTITLTNCTITGTISNSGTGIVTVRNSGTTIGTVGSNITVYNVATLSLTLASGSSIYVADNTGTQQAYVASSGTTYSLDVTGGTGTWSVKIANYGYQAVTYTFTPAVGGTFSFSPTLLPDTYITQPTVATVAAYTTLANTDQVYDYAAYWETTNAGIPTARVASKAGTSVSVGSYPFVFASTGSPLVLSGGTLTFNVTTFGSGTTFPAGLISSGSATLGTATLSYPVLVSGNSISNSWFALTGLQANSSVYVADNTNTQQFYGAGLSGTFTQYIPPTATGTWSWAVECYGLQRQANTFTFSGNVTSIPVKVITDTNIVAIESTVAAYTNLTTAQEIYDYSRYFALSNTGIPYSQLFTKGVGTLSASYNITLSPGATPLIVVATGTITLGCTGLAEATAFIFTGNFTQGTATLSNAVMIRAANLDSELVFTGLDSLTIYATQANALASISPGATSTTGIIRFLFGAMLDGVTMSGTVYTQTTLGSSVQVQPLTLVAGDNIYTVSTTSLLQAIQTTLADIEGTGFITNTNSLTNITNLAQIAATNTQT